MIDAKTTAAIRDYAARAVEERLCGSGDVIAMRTTKGFVVNDGCALSEIDDSRLIEVAAGDTRPEYALLTALFAAREDINAVMITHPAYVCAAARAKVTIPAVVDDMAQIVGVNCKTSRSDSVSDVLAAMKGRNSCLIAGGGALTTGRTLDEAYTCALVLDKAAHVYICGSAIGGCRIINTLEAKLMRFVYKKKYSKTNQKNISEREGD